MSSIGTAPSLTILLSSSIPTHFVTPPKHHHYFHILAPLMIYLITSHHITSHHITSHHITTDKAERESAIRCFPTSGCTLRRPSRHAWENESKRCVCSMLCFTSFLAPSSSSHTATRTLSSYTNSMSCKGLRNRAKSSLSPIPVDPDLSHAYIHPSSPVPLNFTPSLTPSLTPCFSLHVIPQV